MFFQTDIPVILFALTLREAEGMYDCVYVRSIYINMRSIFHVLWSDTEVLLISFRNTAVDGFFDLLETCRHWSAYYHMLARNSFPEY